MGKECAKAGRGGFTLIEILIVVAIISLLSSVVLVGLGPVQRAGRDARRLSDIRRIEQAVTLYDTQHGGRYPASGGALLPNSGWSNSNDTSWTTLANVMGMGPLPVDPQNSPGGWPGAGTSHSYAYVSIAAGCGAQRFYMLVYNLESASGPDPGVRDCSGTLWRYGGAGSPTTVKTVSTY